MEKPGVVLYRIPCTYGCIVVFRCTVGTCDRDLKPLYVFDKEAVVANRKFSGVCAWRANLRKTLTVAQIAKLKDVTERTVYNALVETN
jgi:hypothetical protein